MESSKHARMCVCMHVQERNRCVQQEKQAPPFVMWYMDLVHNISLLIIHMNKSYIIELMNYVMQ